MFDSPLLSLANQAEQHAGLLAPILRAYLIHECLTEENLALRLGCPRSALPRLWLCEQPKAERFQADIERIAVFVGVNAEVLAGIIEDAMRV